ncbi:F-box/kelch-repeat protein SKIP20-like [Cryptomeria japonica]|nr:F-box/kelch-repeat protein SKIP20-like [Cryptomeria japonica]XP_059071515.1 F-box/kelch-repeat protein SKIP20-like [Cryptomeria japonica]XP_059071516.1 F-box/kelch-repeat protein SKIP20-like [Cryptomeria japonica]
MDFLRELPEQIFRDILLRVPYICHSKIKQLLEPAKEMLESFQFYQDRIKFGLTKKYICFLEDHISISIYDPTDQSRKLLPPTNAIVHKIINVNHKIVVLGQSRHLTPLLLIYDFLPSIWKHGAEFPTPRPANLEFACCASPDGSIYIAGGNDNGLNELREAAVYKVDEDKWELLPKMHQGMYSCRGLFIEGMFYVIDINRCQRFDPTTRAWTTINMSIPNSCLDVMYAFQRLIAFTSKGIEQYDWEGNLWRQLETLPQHHPVLNVCATVSCDRILFCGIFRNPDIYICKLYMYKPGAPFSERWISVDQPNSFLEGMVQSIATIEI